VIQHFSLVWTVSWRTERYSRWPQKWSPLEFQKEGNIKKIQQLLLQNRHMSIRIIVDQQCYCMEDCHWRSEKKKLCGCFVLHALTAEQEEEQVAECQDLIKMVDSDPNSFQKIVTGDESGCFVYDPLRKWQSSALVGENSPRPKKIRFQKSKGKTMLVIFFDWQGVVHKEFVL